MADANCHSSLKRTANASEEAAKDALEAKRARVDAEYYPRTSVPLQGWLAPCRFCRQWTGASLCITAAAAAPQVPMCKRCQVKLSSTAAQQQQQQLQRKHEDAAAQAQQHLVWDARFLATDAPALGSPQDADAFSPVFSLGSGSSLASACCEATPTTCSDGPTCAVPDAC